MIKFEIKNIDQLLRAYGKVGEVFRKEMKIGFEKSAALVERSAKKKTPVDTGHLRRSIRRPRQIRLGDKQVAVGSNLRYALKQHEGLHFSHTTGEAKFLDRALKENEKKIIGFFKKMIDNIITQLAEYK